MNIQAQYQAYQTEIDTAMQRVLQSGAFINGPEVTHLEEELTDFCGAHAVACSSGTDALLLALMALDLQPGDQVIVPDFTFFATAEMVALLGGVPIFADIDPVTFNIDPLSVERLVSQQTKGIIAVSLFGQCPDFSRLRVIANQHHLWLIEDAAQSFGATQQGVASCHLTDLATTSFFPAKPLGCYGDGGAVFTRTPELASRVRLLLNHGSQKRYHHERVGINGRLDSLQAAILRVKLKHFPQEIKRRQSLAQQYHHFFQSIEGVTTPTVASGNTSTWAQYTLKVPQREAFIASLQAVGIPTSVHYPSPLHSQPCWTHLPHIFDYQNPVTQECCQTVVSLPMCAFADSQALLSALQRLKPLDRAESME